MKTISVENNRYPQRDKNITNFAITPWFNDRYKEVLLEGNPTRIAKYKNMDPLDLVVEEPLAIFREDGYFHSTIIARKNGLCFPDPKIKLFSFEDFLKRIDPDKKLYQSPTVPEVLDKDNLEEMANIFNFYPRSPAYYLTKIKGSKSFALLVFSDKITLNLDDIFNKIFKEYSFQDITGMVIEKGEEGYPVEGTTELTGYVTGTITLTELLLKESSVEIKILNMKLIRNLLKLHHYYHDGDTFYNGEITYSGVNEN